MLRQFVARVLVSCSVSVGGRGEGCQSELTVKEMIRYEIRSLGGCQDSSGHVGDKLVMEWQASARFGPCLAGIS